jgi:hypothetical protein
MKIFSPRHLSELCSGDAVLLIAYSRVFGPLPHVGRQEGGLPITFPLSVGAMSARAYCEHRYRFGEKCVPTALAKFFLLSEAVLGNRVDICRAEAVLPSLP